MIRWICLCLLLAGCASDVVRLRGVIPMNLNEAGESTPVNVRIYQVKDDKRFLEAEFEDLWVRDKEVLQDDYVSAPAVATVLPGGENDTPAEVPLGTLSSDAKFIGVMALYGKKWTGQERRRIVHVQDLDNCVFELRGYGIVLDIEKEFLVLDPTTPVEIRVYQIERETAFLEADARELAAKDKEILEEDLRGTPVVAKIPALGEHGTAPSVQVGPLHPTTRFLGVLALFENRGREENRRAVIRLSERKEYTFDLCGYQVLVKLPSKEE